MPTEDQLKQIISDTLRKVQLPGGGNLFDAGLVSDVRGEGQTLHVTLRSSGFPPPIAQRLQGEVAQALKANIPALAGVEVKWETDKAPGSGSGPAPVASGPAHAHGHPAPSAGGMPSGFEVKHVIAVGSGKGGVGKSTVAASLAYALQERGFAVGLMDADVYGPSIPHMLGITEKPDEEGGKIIPPVMDGLKVMSMGLMIAESQAVIWRGPMLHKAVRDFLFLVDWGPLDYLIIDLPPGTGDVVLSLSQSLPLSAGVIVCTPQDVALLDAKKALSMLRQVKIPCRGVVENMSYFEVPGTAERVPIFGHGGAQTWAQQEGLPFLGHLPIVMKVRENGDRGQVRENLGYESGVRDALLQIADRLVAEVNQADSQSMPAIEGLN